MQDLIKKYDIPYSFYDNYFVCNAENRLGIEVASFLLFRKGKFIHPQKKKQYMDQYIREEIENFYTYNQLNIHQINFCVTTHCTLKCIHCNALFQYFDYDTHSVLSFTDFRSSFCNLTNAINKIYRLNFIGGEPFLNNDLALMLDYACNNNKISYINIQSNGTVQPSRALLDVLVKHCKKIVIIFSDYTKNKELKCIVQLDKIINTLNQNNIRWQTPRGQTWRADYGFSLQHDEYIQQTVEKFNSCQSRRCWQVLDGVLSHCVKTSAAKALDFEYCNDSDYIYPLAAMESEVLRKSIISLYRKNYLSLCKYCAITSKEILPAEQVKITKNAILGYLLPS